eukprot:gene11077-3328_t
MTIQHFESNLWDDIDGLQVMASNFMFLSALISACSCLSEIDTESQASATSDW